MTDGVLKELDATGVKTLINIKTLNGNQKFSSKLVNQMMVSKQVLTTTDQIHLAKLPKSHSRKEIPVDPSEVGTPIKLKKLSYLDCISSRIAPDDAVSIDVIIGANCTKTLEQTDFITSKNGGS